MNPFSKKKTSSHGIEVSSVTGSVVLGRLVRFSVLLRILSFLAFFVSPWVACHQLSGLYLCAIRILLLFCRCNSSSLNKKRAQARPRKYTILKSIRNLAQASVLPRGKLDYTPCYPLKQNMEELDYTPIIAIN